MNDELFFKQVGERIRYLRRKKGYGSYDGFAWTNDINRQTMLNAEQGKPITFKSFIKILNSLEVTPEEFFKGIK
jgi:DNA-binding XRE family transcriptional regulator